MTTNMRKNNLKANCIYATEEDVLNGFKKLGWEISIKNSNTLSLKKIEQREYLWGFQEVSIYIHFDLVKKTYSSYELASWMSKGYALSINEHKLIHALMQFWRWI